MLLAAVLQHKGMELTVAPGLSEGVRKAELPCAVGRCCWLPAAGSALLELRLQLQLGAEQAASCLRGGLGSFEKERPLVQVQSHSCFVCWWLWEDHLGCRSGSDCLLAIRLKMGGCPDRDPLASRFPRQERGTVLSVSSGAHLCKLR